MAAATPRSAGGRRTGNLGIGRRIGALGCAVALIAAGRAAAVSYEGERELGRRFDLALRQQAPMISDPEVIGYVTEVGRKIVGTLDDSYFDYQFAVVRDPRVNAFAVPGGYVYVNSGLLANVKNEDELAAVLGHEIGHVHAHHAAEDAEQQHLGERPLHVRRHERVDQEVPHGQRATSVVPPSRSSAEPP